MEELKLAINSCDESCSMIFDLDEFLPCKTARFRRFLKLIDRSEPYYRPQHFKQLSEHLARREAEYTELWKLASRRCIDYQTEANEAKRMAETGKRPSGATLSPEELKRVKVSAKELSASYKKTLRCVKQTKANKELCGKNLELLREEGKRWM
uniref:Uncharacterized protein n=1 Tax=Siphoviridae sp. ctr0N4 TaxID=2826473 RepID=A0A8S5M075_9CAUD|nr:MAG TPA: hypothetical protein [Siphoviridae sp. ctr0N4]